MTSKTITIVLNNREQKTLENIPKLWKAYQYILRNKP